MHKLLKNFLSTSVANVLGQLVGFISILYYSRVIEEYNFGVITYAQQFILYFTTIVLFGVQTFGTKLVINKEKEESLLLSEISSFRLIISCILCVLCILCSLVSFFLLEDRLFSVILILWSPILLSTAYNFDWYFAGIQDMKHNAVYNLFKTVAPAIIIFIFVRSKEQGTIFIPIAMVLGVFLGAIYYIIILRKRGLKVKIKMSKDVFKGYFSMGLPFLLSGILAMVNGNIDKIVLGAINNYEGLGVYQSAYTLVNFIITFIGIICLVLFPIIVKSYKDGKPEILETVSKIVFMVVIPISFGIFSLSKEIIMLFFGLDYIGAVVPLKILMVYIFILGIREVYAYSLNAFGLERKYLKIVAISATANFLLNVILTPFYGYVMAAVITTATEIINLVLMRKAIREIVKFNDFKQVFLVTIPAIIMTIIIYFLKQFTSSIFIIIPIAIIVYFVAIIGLKIVNVKQIKETLRE